MDENDLEAQHIEMNRKKWDSWAPNFDNKRFSLFPVLAMANCEYC